MKKHLLAILIAILCLSMMVVFTACGGGPAGPCEEHSGDWTLVKSATCEDKGSEKRICTVCQEEETREVEALGHDWNDWNVIKEVTCTTDGKQTRTCKNCSEADEETIVHEGHDYKKINDFKMPSATADGQSEGKKCTVCGEIAEPSLIYHKFTNVANKATFSSTGNDFWAIDWTRLFDGNDKTGTNSPKGRNFFIYMDYENPMYLEALKVVCNGYGTYKAGAGETTENTYNISKLKIVLYSIEKVDETTGEPLYKEEFATDVIDTSSLLEVNIADYGYTGTKLISRIGINIQDGPIVENKHPGDNGVYYLYEITANGSTLITECDSKGCDWGEWTETKAPQCTKEALINGEERRDCSRCDKYETRPIVATHDWGEFEVLIPAACGVDGYQVRYCDVCEKEDAETVPMPYDHNWSEWKSDSYDCTAGGTRTKECLNKGCGATDSETVEPGKHLNLITEGYKAPTETEEGSTGTTKCSSCGNIISEAKVISKIKNVLTGATASTTNTHWHVTAQNGTSGVDALIDGNKENGSASDPGNHFTYIYLELAEATTDLSKIILTVNGKGYIPAIWANVAEVTNNNYRIRVNVYDESNNVIFESQEYNTLDIIDLEIDVALAEGASAKKIEIIRSSDTSNNYLWEVQALGGGKIIEE